MQTTCITGTGCESMPANNLRNIFEEIGKKYGYETVSAEYSAFKDFKVKWTRSYKWIDFLVSDYLADAPDEAIRSIAETLFSRINGGEAIPYSEEFCNFAMSKDFVKTKQPIYIKRSRNIAKTAVGEHYDLNEIYKKVLSMGLVKRDDDIIFSWTKDEGMSSPSYMSTLMKVVVVNRVLDDENTPEDVMKYVILKELVEMERGKNNFCKRKGLSDEMADAIINHCGLKQQAEDWLWKNYLQI